MTAVAVIPEEPEDARSFVAFIDTNNAVSTIAAVSASFHIAVCSASAALHLRISSSPTRIRIQVCSSSGVASIASTTVPVVNA